MNLITKLQSKEGKWIRILFADSSFMTGRLMSIGSDFIQIECFGKDEIHKNNLSSYSQHIIPLNLIKLITIEADSFLEAERKRLEYVSSQPSDVNNLHDLEK